MVIAVRTCLQKYATFKGGAKRPEYWWFVLFVWLVDLVFTILRVPIVGVIWEVAMFLPTLSAGVRRLHDSGHSGWWYLLPIGNLILLCFPSKTEFNKYVSDDYLAANAPTYLEPEASPSSMACPQCGKLRLPGQNYCKGCGAKLSD